MFVGKEGLEQIKKADHIDFVTPAINLHRILSVSADKAIMPNVLSVKLARIFVLH